MATPIPLLAPIYLPGQEPVPPGTTPEERAEMQQAIKYQKMLAGALESCPLKVVMSGGAGLGLGAFFSLMSASFAYEDPLSRASTKLVGTRAQTAFMFKEMGRNMWTTGKGFGKVGALYSGVECCIEGVSLPLLSALRSMKLTDQYRAKNDITNAVSAGFFAGALLARQSGIKAMVGGGAAFAAFSGVIDWWLRSPPSEEI